MIKNHNLSRLGYSTKVYKQELRKKFISHQNSSIRSMMKVLLRFELPIMYIPGNVETKESVAFLETNYANLIFLDENHTLFQDQIHFFGLGGSLDHHGIVCDHEFSNLEYKMKVQKLEKKIQLIPEDEPRIFVFHEPPYFTLADRDVQKMMQKAKKRGYTYNFTNKAGSKDLYELITKYDPYLVINGHFHEYSGLSKINNSIVVNPGALATYNYGIITVDIQQRKKYDMKFFKIYASPYNFTNFLYQKRNFLTNNVINHS
jgi:Icc-related predicted phosphoesterase